MGISFEWNRKKAAANAIKHGVGFEEAATVFGDPLSLTIEDAAHSEGESRWITMGKSDFGRLVVVAHTERGERIRIITARLATKVERKAYEGTT